MSSAPILTGVRVLDLTTVVFGPYATQILADLGADVIKVEAPGGDTFRYAGKPAQTRGMGPQHLNLNRGKRSIVLDLKDAGDQETMRDLVRLTDVFIHNVRLDAIERLGFGPDACRALREDLIYVHCVGFGSKGPYAGLQAYDDVIQAASGAATLAGRVDGAGAPRYLPSLIADKVAGLNGAQAVLAAYIHRMRSGDGQFVEVPMFEAFTQFMMLEHLGAHTFVPPNGDAGYARQLDPDRQPFPTADGHISVVPYTPDVWVKVFDVLGDSAFLTRPEFSSVGNLLANQSLLYARMAELTPQRTTAAWLEAFTNARVPCMAVRDLSAMADDPHLRQTGFFSEAEHPSEGRYLRVGSPTFYSANAAPPPRHAPLVGGDGDEIRREIEALKRTAKPG